ncbi:hypothetical protein RND61_15575 [Streptomyces sp. TRM76323]|uniref:Uncharacterized protein n=1 Tax=Streptomyces tamarix TaxID=3078565 RepID=A0ABU3QL23_9ACTN|nr:hypothetical protein [Streptomyces tamarix]MDT9683468.1 hypothetical protein [Streptomyces tamarix]
MKKLVVSRAAFDVLKEFRTDNKAFPLDGLLNMGLITNSILIQEDLSSEGEHLVLRYLLGDPDVALLTEKETHRVAIGDVVTLSTGEKIVLDESVTFTGHTKG